MLADVKMRDAGRAIENRRNFQVKARRSVRDRLGIVWSLRGYDPMDCFGHYGPAAMNAGQATQRDWIDVQYRIEHDRARYVVESYQTVIGWERHDGVWVIPDRKYSLATTRHQKMLVVRSCMDFTDVITTVSALKGKRARVVLGLDGQTLAVEADIVGVVHGNVLLTRAVEDSAPLGVLDSGDYAVDVGRIESIEQIA